MAETRTDAEAAFDGFIESYGVKYEKAVECLSKDRGSLLAFYDFPAEHWKHLRTTNPIESTIATVRHRKVRSRGCLSNKSALAMIFKLAQAAEKSWHRLRGHNQLPKVILGVKFNDGIEVVRSQAQAAAADPGRHQDSAITQSREPNSDDQFEYLTPRAFVPSIFYEHVKPERWTNGPCARD